jgi:O-antigen ligase
LLDKVPHLPVVLTFLVVSAVSLFVSQYLKYSLREYRVVILEPLLFYVLLTTTLEGNRDALRLANVFIFLGAVVAAFSLYHYLFVGVVEATGGVRRLLAVYHSPNALALFLGRFLAFCWPFLLLSQRWRRWPYLVAFGLGLTALYLTYSRGAWLAVGFSLLFVVALVGSRRILLAAAGAGALLATVVAFLLPWGRLLSQTTSARRLYIWQAAWNIVRDHPLFGIGLDNFLYHYPDYMVKEAWQEPHISHPHNILLDFWTRLGILGVLAMAWLQTIFWRTGARIYVRVTSREERVLVLALMSGMLEGLAHGLIDNSFFLIDLAMVFWFFFGLMALMERCVPRGQLASA